MQRLLTVLVLAVLVPAACGDKKGDAPGGEGIAASAPGGAAGSGVAPALGADPAAGEEGTGGTEPSGSTASDIGVGGADLHGAGLDPKMLPAGKLKKEEILVGGCRDTCEDPKNAFRNFVRALLARDAEGKLELKSFIDTTMLKDNGEALGEKWAGLWLDGKKDERKASVDAWVDGFRKRCGKVKDPAQVEESLASGVTMSRVSSGLVKFEYVVPERSDRSNADAWTVTMGMRGLEWLVQEIYDR